VLWTLLLAGGMYLTYDQLRENPASIAHSDIMSLFGDNPGVVAIRLLVFLKKLAGYDPITDRNQPGWTHFHENYLRQQDGAFTPKTVEELFVGGLVAVPSRPPGLDQPSQPGDQCGQLLEAAS
jgi:hypothetical protein